MNNIYYIEQDNDITQAICEKCKQPILFAGTCKDCVGKSFNKMEKQSHKLSAILEDIKIYSKKK